MKALVYTGKLGMEIRDEPMPSPGENQSLIQVDAAGICGSDMHAYHGLDPRRVPPMILGHEIAGKVLEGPMKGKRVAINPLISCMQCRECRMGHNHRCPHRDLIGLGRAGGYSEFLVADNINLFEISDKLSAKNASLMEPTAVSLHAVVMAEKILTRPITESRALVIGGGAIGVLAALILKQKGVRELTIAETSKARRDTLKTIGCGETHDPIADSPLSESSFDLVVDAVGSGRTRSEASRVTRAGGVISHIGLQDNEPGLDTRKLTLQEITFIGHYTYTATDLQAALNLIDEGGLGDLSWVESRSLDDGAQAFDDIHTGIASAPKIVLHPAEWT